MPRIFHRISCLALALAASGLSACCNRTCAPVAGSPLQAAAPPVLVVAPAPLPADYRAQGGDILKITVYGEDDLSGDYTVGPDGAVALPLVGAVKVAGSTLADLPDVIAAAYRGGYLVDPKVSVEVKGRP